MTNQALARRLRRIAEHLEREGEQHLEHFFPYWPLIVLDPADQPEHADSFQKLHERLERIEECCAGVSGTTRHTSERVELLVGVGGRERASNDRRTLRQWIAGAEVLTVADPYFFRFDERGSDRTKAQYVEALIELLPRSLRFLEVFHLEGPDSEILGPFRKACATRGISFSSVETNRIHDRVWIRDTKQAVIVGTSFGGLGNKLAFILDLPNGDLQAFRRELHAIRN